MDRSWIHGKKFSTPYINGVDQFMSCVRRHFNKTDDILCPCRHCLNLESLGQSEVREHILCNGMDSRYTRWVHHGEELTDDEGHNFKGDADGHNFEDDADGHNFEGAGYQSDDDGFDQGNRDDVTNLLDELYRSGRQADGQPNLFANLMDEAKKELYDGCTKFTRLSFIIKLLHVKSYNRVTNAAFDGFLKLFNLACPNGNLVPKSYSEAKRVLRDVGLDYEIIHVCKFECELFWGEYAEHDHCPTCGTSRWKDTHGKKKVPQKVLRYFPIIPRLQRFFASKFLAEMAMWHKVKRVVEKDVMRHPADGEAWKGFDSEYGWFARDPRNLKLGIATDGFNPFGMSSSYSMWPVFVIPYNFPPWMCMDQSNFMMALLIPGRRSPGKDFHVYMKPLMADMKKLWEGVDTFDALTEKRFPLHAAILWSIHDYPGLATISGRSTKGFYACVHCDENPCSQSLRNKIGYVGHRRFLPTNHHFRTSKLFNGKAERRGPPRKFTIEEVMEKLGKVEDYKPGKHPDFKKRKRAEKGQPNWSQKVSFYDLPYWSKLKLPHNLDVMHIEKNICDNILGTLLEIDRKSKDTTNARKDLEDLRIRKKLHMRPDGKGGFEKPPACYTLSKENKKKLCQFLANVKFPDGYAANLARCVDLDACKVHDLKTHDCHILLQRVLPAGLRGLVTQDIYEAIAELGNFFKELCSKTLRLDVLRRLKDQIPLILCKLEKIFPPAFFDVMVHLAVHLPDEAIQRGPVHYGWMYPVERRLGYLKGTVRNKARPEGSIAETYIVDECLIYCSRFLNDDVETRFNKDERNRDGKRVVDPAELPVFSVAAKAFGACRLKYFEKEYEKMVWYVIDNCTEAQKYVNVCREELLSRGVNNIDETVEKEFPRWFQKHIEKLYSQGDPEVSDDLHSLAFGPDERVLVHTACNVNGVRYHTVDREKNRRTQNSGILTIAPDHNGVEKEYYGVLKQVLELQYLKNKHGDRSVFLYSTLQFHILSCHVDSQPIVRITKRGRRRETMGHGLQDYSRRNGGAKMHIEFKEGKSRPPDPTQSSKLTSECGIHIRKNMPLVRHWKEYKDDGLKNVVPNAIKAVANKFDMDKDSELAQDVCTRIIQKGVRNRRYKLKRDYFTKVSPDKRLANVPPKMSRDNWELLCNKWSNPDFQRLCAKNKQNREGVRQHQCTGSRSYVAHLTFCKAKYNNEEPDVIDFYKESHTKKDGSMSADAAAAHSAMQAKRMESQSDGATSKSDTQIVAEVLRETSSSSTFLANLGFPASLRRPPSASARQIQELQERLHTQERDAREAQERQQGQFSSRLQTQQREIEDLRRRQQEELEEIRKKHQEEIENIKNSQQEKNGALEKKQQEMDAVLGYLLRQQAQASATSSAIPKP